MTTKTSTAPSTEAPAEAVADSLTALALAHLTDMDAAKVAKARIDGRRPDLVEAFREAGVTRIDAASDRGLMMVEPEETKCNEDALKAWFKRYAPEHYDVVFPPALDKKQLKALMAVNPDIAKKLTKLGHVKTSAGSVQFRAYDVK